MRATVKFCAKEDARVNCPPCVLSSLSAISSIPGDVLCLFIVLFNLLGFSCYIYMSLSDKYCL